MLKGFFQTYVPGHTIEQNIYGVDDNENDEDPRQAQHEGLEFEPAPKDENEVVDDKDCVYDRIQQLPVEKEDKSILVVPESAVIVQVSVSTNENTHNSDSWNNDYDADDECRHQNDCSRSVASSTSTIVSHVEITSSSIPPSDGNNHYLWHIKVILSCLLLLLCIMVTLAVNFEEKMDVENRLGVSGYILLLINVVLLYLLAAFEGALVCLVGLQPLDKELYRDSHPITYRCVTLAHDGNSMSRFIAGKQCMLIFLVFLIDFLTAPMDDVCVLGLPDWACNIFLHWKMAVAVITVLLADIVPQLLGAECMLDFMNSYVMLSVIHLALGVERSGLFHAAYLVPIAVERYQGVDLGYGYVGGTTDICDGCDGAGDNNSSARTRNQRCENKFIFGGKVVMSLTLFSFALVLIAIALFNGATTMWDEVDDGLSFLLFLIMIIWVAVVQGMQIALFALKRTSIRDLKRTHWSAHVNFQAAFGAGNIEPFLIGRQIFVTASLFYLSKVTHLLNNNNEDDDDGFDILQGTASPNFREIFVSNVLGVLVTAIPLLWGRLAAACMPRLFLSNLLILPNIYFCKAIGSLGIVDASWPIVAVLKSPYLGWYKCDADYLPNYMGGTTDRASRIDASCASSFNNGDKNRVSRHADGELEGDDSLHAPLIPRGKEYSV